jgi:OmpA-OmpF porin, OOP family
MKKIITACIALYLLTTSVHAQDDEIRPPAIGVSFFFNDFTTAQRIRSTSLSQVFRDQKWAKTSEMNPGIGIHYFKGLKKHIDLDAALEGCFTRYPFPNKTFSSDRFLLEASATANFKMTTEAYWVQPYFIAGIGAHVYSQYWGAFIPLGLGIKVNFFDDAHLFMTGQYRVPVTAETANYHFNYSLGIAGAIGKKK